MSCLDTSLFLIVQHAAPDIENKIDEL
jgi:hypothetical protein